MLLLGAGSEEAVAATLGDDVEASRWDQALADVLVERGTLTRFQATKMAIHAAMIEAMDREIGRIDAAVEEEPEQVVVLQEEAVKAVLGAQNDCRPDAA